MTSRFQPCDDGSEFKTCDASHRFKPCTGSTCWRVLTVAFDLCPPAISFACAGCDRPGLEFRTYRTSDDPEDPALDVMVPITVNLSSICGATVNIPFHLQNCSDFFVDCRPTYNIFAYITCRGTKTATRFLDPPSDDCPDICTQLGLPRLYSDPGGPCRLSDQPTPNQPCGTWCVTRDGVSDINPHLPHISLENCQDFSGACTPGPS